MNEKIYVSAKIEKGFEQEDSDFADWILSDAVGYKMYKDDEYIKGLFGSERDFDQLLAYVSTDDVNRLLGNDSNNSKAYYLFDYFEAYCLKLISVEINTRNNNKIVLMCKKCSERHLFVKSSVKDSFIDSVKTGVPYLSTVDPEIKPDIVLKNAEKYFVFDVKLKNHIKRHNTRDDRLQILAYKYMFQSPVYGHIFPVLTDETPEVRYCDSIDEHNTISKYFNVLLCGNPEKDKDIINDLLNHLEEQL